MEKTLVEGWPSGLGAGYRLGPSSGRTGRVLGGRVRVLAAAEHTRGALAVVEGVFPVGSEVPRHVHQSEDLAVYVVEGELQLHCADETWVAEPGTFVRLPRGVPHAGCVVGVRTARVLLLAWPAGVEEVLAELGASAIDAPRRDRRRLEAIAAKYHITRPRPPDT